MKIQLSPKRILKDITTVWIEAGPEVDIVMDLKNLTFRPGSVSEIYSFHVLDHLFADEVKIAMANWHKTLAEKGMLIVVTDDFEYIARGFVGGDISINLFNDIHNHPYQCTRDGLVEVMEGAGFNSNNLTMWFEGGPNGVVKKHYELLLTAKK